MFFFLNLFETNDDIIKLRKNLLIAAVSTIILTSFYSNLKNTVTTQTFANFNLLDTLPFLLGLLSLITGYLLTIYLFVIIKEYFNNAYQEHFTTCQETETERKLITEQHENKEFNEKVLQYLDMIERDERLQALAKKKSLHSQRAYSSSCRHKKATNSLNLLLIFIPLLFSFYAVTITFQFALFIFHTSWPY